MKRIKLLLTIILFLTLGLGLSGCFLKRFWQDNKPKKPEPNTTETTPTVNEQIKDNSDDIEIISQEYREDKTIIKYQVKMANIKQILLFYKAYDNKQNIIISNLAIITKNFTTTNTYEISFSLPKYHELDIKCHLNETVTSYDLDNNYYLLINNGSINNQIITVKKSANQLPYIKPDFADVKYAAKGYYYDKFFNKALNQNDKVNSNNIIYTKLVLDFNIINRLQTEIIKSNVTIFASNYTSGSQGSGGVIHEINKGFFILTNSHVVTDNNNEPYKNIKVENYKKETANGHLLYNEPTYDLALIFVYKNNNSFWSSEIMKDLKPLKLAKHNPLVGESIIAIGQPKGQKNTITAGIIQTYEMIKVKDGISPKFPVIKHSAPIDHGSSGGILLNVNFEICGINFAGSTELNDPNPNCAAIPVERIKEMINRYNESVN